MCAKKKSLSSVNLGRYKSQDARHEAIKSACRILIVCEGTKTEPNYFKSFNSIKRGGRVYDITCDGAGTNTRWVVQKAIKMRDEASDTPQAYDSVWAVFDRDSFLAANFNAAIQLAAANGIGCAWSNEAFELWYLYHFVNRTTGMSRKEYQDELEKYICKKRPGFKYAKNMPDMHDILEECGNEPQAIRWAEKQAATFGHNRYAEHNPATHVYKLVRLLRGEDKEFNEMLLKDMNQEGE